MSTQVPENMKNILDKITSYVYLTNFILPDRSNLGDHTKRDLAVVRYFHWAALRLPDILHIFVFSLHPSRQSLHNNRGSRRDFLNTFSSAGFYAAGKRLSPFSFPISPSTSI